MEKFGGQETRAEPEDDGILKTWEGGDQIDPHKKT